MAPNIQIDNGNFAISNDGTSFYTMDHNTNRLIEKNSSGTVIFSYFLDTDVSEVYSLKFDGYYLWSLEKQGSDGFLIRKWEFSTSGLVEKLVEFAYASDSVNIYKVFSMAVEYYLDVLDNSTSAGQATIDVEDGSVIRVGDDIVIGPSESVGFEGEYNKVSVIAKVGNSITVSPALSAAFGANTEIYFSRNFFVFSDEFSANLTGVLYKFNSSTGSLQTVYTSNLFNQVRASVFFKNHLMFIRAGEVIWLDPDSQNINKSQAIDNLNEDRTEHLETQDLAGFSNTLYRLEAQRVFLSGSQYDTEVWPNYNYNTSSVVPEVYFLAVKADPPIVHKSGVGIPAADTQSRITVDVLDQFRTPIFNRLVSFSSDGGSLSPTSDTTDSEGRVETTYTANSEVGQIIVTATAT